MMLAQNLVRQLSGMRHATQARRGIVLPRSVLTDLPKSEKGLLLDTRPSGSRRVIDSRLVRKDKEFRLEYADGQDHAMLQEAIVRLFLYCSILDGKPDKFNPYTMTPSLHPFVDNNIDKGVSMLAFKGNKLVAFRVARYIEGPCFEINLGPRDAPPKLDWPEDHSKAIDDVVTDKDKRGSAQLTALVAGMEQNVARFLSRDVNKVLLSDLATCHPAYQRYGLTSTLSRIAEEKAQTDGAQGGFSVTISTGSIEMRRRMGYTSLFNIPYDRFLDYGEQVYKDHADGVTAAHIMWRKY